MRNFLILFVFLFSISSCKTAQSPMAVEQVPENIEVTQTSTEVSLEESNLLGNSDFETGVSAPWMPVILSPAKAEADIIDSAFCINISERGANNWDIQLAHRGLVIEEGHRYEVRAKIWSTAQTSARAKVGMSVSPYREHWSQELMIDTEPKWFSGSFVKNKGDDRVAEFAIHIGGSLARLNNLPFTVCIDDVGLYDPKYVKPKTDKQLPLSGIRVNQVGYLPGYKKTATVPIDSTTPIEWSLLKDGKHVATGLTSVFGNDVASNQHVHIIDFSEVNTEGDNFQLIAGDRKSHTFQISKDIYKQMSIDAARYFYHHRAGVPIEMPFADKELWVRPAGHLSDNNVPCLPEMNCGYSLDVQGGWYDAGDHGKYVVNAGYSVWTMLNLYERSLHLTKTKDIYKDGSLNIPESKNGISDLLDEVRVELEFMLKMEVPDKHPLAGMVHHKIHDEDWTGIPTAPHKSNVKRYLHAPSTAATLNLSATAAQCARIWKDIDSEFSRKCLDAAIRTYNAAKKHPKIYASAEDTKGGGPYEDSRVNDEFYWAAVELFITTGQDSYKKELLKSPHFAAISTVDDVEKIGLQRGAMTWQSVEALGHISLVTVPNKLKEKDTKKLIEKITKAAESGVQVLKKEGYRIAFTSAPQPDYYWGSNFIAMNNLILLAVAHDLTNREEFRQSLVEGTDYLLGRNPLDQCYVTGYGARPLRNPHHRFFAFQADPTYPAPPPGFISGGPNQNRQDPRIQASVPKSAAPAAQFVDHIDSYSTNEVAINWNAAFVWLTAYLSEVEE